MPLLVNAVEVVTESREKDGQYIAHHNEAHENGLIQADWRYRWDGLDVKAMHSIDSKGYRSQIMHPNIDWFIMPIEQRIHCRGECSTVSVAILKSSMLDHRKLIRRVVLCFLNRLTWKCQEASSFAEHSWSVQRQSSFVAQPLPGFEFLPASVIVSLVLRRMSVGRLKVYQNCETTLGVLCIIGIYRFNDHRSISIDHQLLYISDENNMVIAILFMSSLIPITISNLGVQDVRKPHSVYSSWPLWIIRNCENTRNWNTSNIYCGSAFFPFQRSPCSRHRGESTLIFPLISSG